MVTFTFTNKIWNLENKNSIKKRKKLSFNFADSINLNSWNIFSFENIFMIINSVLFMNKIFYSLCRREAFVDKLEIVIVEFGMFFKVVLFSF